MITNRKTVCLLLIISVALITINKGFAGDDDNDWREKMKYQQYAPRYFGPNAFPMPELRSGLLETQWEAELRGEYHLFEGDCTKDVYMRLFVPIAEGRAGFQIGGVVYEYYKMTLETVEERHAAGKSWDSGAQGDVVVSSFYQLLRSGEWADILLEATLKTASGNRLVDARYTDAAAYWFVLNIGRDVYKRRLDNNFHVRVLGLAGFYCWMTNDLMHRQNDAFVFSAGVSGSCKNFSVKAYLSGLYGYKNNGDRPLQLRTELIYGYGKNSFSFRYKHGMRDALYDTFSLAYIRCF
jgi:hypothetical protein